MPITLSADELLGLRLFYFEWAACQGCAVAAEDRVAALPFTGEGVAGLPFACV